MTEKVSIVQVESRRKKAIVIAGLMAGKSMREAAAEADIRPATVTDWNRNDVEFQEMLANATEDVERAIIAEGQKLTLDRLHKLGESAVKVIEDMLTSDSEKTRLAAANSVLRFAPKAPRSVSVHHTIEQVLTSDDRRPLQGD